MKTTEEKLAFKNHFFKLGQGILIDITNESFWSKFWLQPASINDIFELITPQDIQTIRDQNKVNFISLVYKLFMELIAFSESTVPLHHQPVLNVIHFLTKIIPELYEHDYDEIIDKLLLNNHYNPLDFIPAANSLHSTPVNDEILVLRVVRSIIKLLFFKGFTISPTVKPGDGMINLTVWEPGIGITSKYQPPDLIMESNRTSLIKLLITLCGSSLYQVPSKTVVKGSVFTTSLVTSLPRLEILTLVCSLFNVLCRSVKPSTESMMHFNDGTIKYLRYNYVYNCIQLLTLMIIYPIPSNTTFVEVENRRKPHNMSRLYIGKLHKDNELLYLGSSLINGLKTDIDQYRPPIWSMELFMIFWELIQCNARFRDIGKQFFNELNVLLVYYIRTFNHPQYKNLIRLCSCLLLYLSHTATSNLMDPDPEFFNRLPPHMLPEKPLGATTRDIVVIQICNVLSKNTIARPGEVNLLVTATLVEVLYNIVPLIGDSSIMGTNDHNKKLNNVNPGGGLSYSASTALTNLIVRFSTRSFLLKNPINADLLALLIRSICISSFHNKSSRMLLFTILKSEKVYDMCWNTVLGLNNEYFDGKTLIIKSQQDKQDEEKQSGDEDILDDLELSRRNSTLSIQSQPPPNQLTDHQMQDGESVASSDDEFEQESEAIEESLAVNLPSGMTKKAKGKHRKEATINKTWGGKDALRIIVTIIIPYLKLSLNEVLGETSDTFTLIESIENLNFSNLADHHKHEINGDFMPLNSFTPLKFIWSQVSLGWYISLLYGGVYNSGDNVSGITGGKNKLIKNITSSFMSIGKIFTSEDSISVLETPATIEELEKRISPVNPWASTAIKLFKIEANVGFFDALNSKLVNESRVSLSRRLSDLRVGYKTSMTPKSPSGLNTPKEEPEMYFPRKNSVTSLHSLNTLNRTRSNTPRNSMSM